MSLVRKTSHDSFKRSNFFVFSTVKSIDILTTSVKGAALVFLIISISLVLYTAFGTQTRWFCLPECDRPTRNDAVQTWEAHEFTGENSAPTNLSHIVFGIGGSTHTWKDRRHYSELWWQPNATRGYVWLEEKPDPSSTWSENSPPYRVSEDWTRFKYSSSQPAVRIARIVVDTFRLGLPNARWFVMGDDDTVFFADNLVSVLARYDHRRMYYIGGNSESVEQDMNHSYEMGFGGGGFAVSYPLAAQLVEAMDGCLDRYYYMYGSDERVFACVTEIGVSLTKERGFHQIDIKGDPYGLLAAHPVTPLVSLHHLDYIKPLFPNQTRLESLRTLVQAYRVDPARTMQQCFCYYRSWRRKWTVSISWGYTVQTYPSLLGALELEMPLQTFTTWQNRSDGLFTFNTRPMSPDPCERPVIYYLDWVQEGKGETLSCYKRNVDESGNTCRESDYRRAVDRVIVSSLKMEPQEWKEAPRRQCCEISSLKYGRMKVRIRRCKRWETVAS